MADAMKGIACLLLLNALAASAARAQEITVGGRVTDRQSDQPVAGAIVSVDGDAPQTESDSTGRFTLRVSVGSRSIRVSRIGYGEWERTVEVRDTGEVTLDVALTPVAMALSELEVLGERRAETEMREIRQSAFAVSVIDGQKLAGRGLTLDEALQRATGVQVRRSGGLGSASVFNIRGLEGQRVQVYINGNAADIAGNSFSLDDIPLQLVERVEVYKGVVPARFGGDGLGAAVNVVTIDPEGGYLDAGYTAGSYGQHQLSVTAKRELWDGIAAGVSVNADVAENDYMMESPFLQDVRIRRDHDAFRRFLVGAVLSTDRLWFEKVELEVAGIDVSRQLQGIQTNVQHAETHSRLGVLVLDGEKQGALGGRLDLRVGGAFVATKSGVRDTSSVRYTFDGVPFASPNGRGELSLLPSNSDNRTTLLRQRLAATYRVTPAHTANITWVLDLSRYRPSDPLANAYAGRNVSEFPGEQASAVMGVSHEWRPWGDRVVNVFGARGYAFRSEGTPSNLSDPTAERPPPVRNTTITAGASEAVRYRFTPDLLAKASVEWARRLPSSTELFGDGLLVTPSPTLRPERSVNLNVGLQFERAFQDGRRIQAEASGFWMQLRDMIRLTPGFAGLAAYTNFGRARIAGAEAEVRADITRWLHSAATVTYQDARDQLEHTPGTIVRSPTYGLRLPNMPWLFGAGLIEMRAEDLIGNDTRSRVFAEGSFTGEYFYAFELSQRQERRIPRSMTLGIGLEHAWTRTGLTLSAEVQNLTDATVLNQFNFPLPGRTFRLKLRYTRADLPSRITTQEQR
jgi:vitamin B12 transporter